MYEELTVYVEHIGGGVVTAVMSENHSCRENLILQTCRNLHNMLSAIALSVNQEINQTGT